MAKLNPFAKQKETETTIVEESITGVEEAEITLAPDSSVAYFKEKMFEMKNEEIQANRKAQEKRRELINVLKTLDDEKQKRETKKQEILQKVETLKEEQRKVARDLSLNVGDTGELEKKLNDLSVAILSEQAKAEAFNEHPRLYLPEETRTKIKRAVNEFDTADDEYQQIKGDNRLLNEISQVIRELERIQETLVPHHWGGTRRETGSKIIESYVDYFISEQESEALFNGENESFKENYFATWLTSDSDQTFAQYAKYLLSL